MDNFRRRVEGLSIRSRDNYRITNIEVVNLSFTPTYIDECSDHHVRTDRSKPSYGDTAVYVSILGQLLISWEKYDRYSNGSEVVTETGQGTFTVNKTDTRFIHMDMMLDLMIEEHINIGRFLGYDITFGYDHYYHPELGGRGYYSGGTTYGSRSFYNTPIIFKVLDFLKASTPVCYVSMIYSKDGTAGDIEMIISENPV